MKLGGRGGIGVLGVALLAGALVTGSPADAHAAGLVLDGATLPAETRDKLRAEIETARREVPELYKQVYAIATHANELDAAARVKGAPLTLHFKGLGPRAFHPMLELLAFDARAPKDLTPTAARALRLGLIEAVGIIRDARAVPVLGAILAAERDVDTVRSTSEALGRIGTDQALSLVEAAITKATSGRADDRERALALFDGMGGFKRTAAAKLLAGRLAARPDDASARVIAKSLGSVGNAWAWGSLSDRREEADTREVASRALASAVGLYRGEARGAIERAFLVVDAPNARAHLAEARKNASPDVVAALDLLERKLAANPAR